MTAVQADHRPITYVEDDYVVYRASAIGGCPTALIASRLGIEPGGTPGAVREVADRGVECEGIALAKLADQGWEVWGQQDTIEREHVLAGGQMVLVRGHCDAQARLPGSVLALVEVHSRQPDEFVRIREGRLQPPARKLWQASTYAAILGYSAVAYVAICRETEEVWPVLYTPPPYAWKQVVERIEEVEEAVAWGEVPTCYGDGTEGWCPYYDLHQRRPHQEAEDLVEALNDALFAHETWKDSQARREAALAELRQAMGDRTRVCAGEVIAQLDSRGRLTVRRRTERDEVQ